MSYLIDTNILLRFLLQQDSNFAEIRRAVRLLKSRREKMYITGQTIAEFWNVCTRPITARGGLGLSVSETKSRLELLERNFLILPDSPKVYEEWKRLVENYKVSGVQVHDARLVATMNVFGIQNIITLNTKDFSRYQNILVIEPKNVQ
jgi:predicted nucleic acid-binding protein